MNTLKVRAIIKFEFIQSWLSFIRSLFLADKNVDEMHNMVLNDCRLKVYGKADNIISEKQTFIE